MSEKKIHRTTPLRQQTAQELEQGLLAACWNDEKNAKLLLSTATEKDFHTPSASLQFRILKEGWKAYRSCEVHTLKKLSADRGWADSFSNVLTAWASNDWSGYGPNHLRSLIDQVRDESCRFNIHKALEESKSIMADPDKTLEQAQAEMAALLSEASFIRRRREAQNWDQGFAKLEERAEQRLQDETAGKPIHEHLPTGMVPLDEIIGGIGVPEFCLLAARPGVGKTAAGLQIGTYIAEHSGPVLFLSLEMSAKVCWTRIACQQLRMPAKEFAKRPDLLRQVRAKNINLFIDDSPVKAGQLLQRIELFLLEHPGTVLIIVDQLSKLVDDSSDFRQMTFGCDRACAVTTTLGVPLILLTQVGRKSELRKDARPSINDLKMTGSLEENARKIIFIDREWTRNPGKCDPRLAKFIVGKNGDGSIGDADMHYDGPSYTFYTPVESEFKGRKKKKNEAPIEPEVTPTLLDMELY